MNKTKTLKKNYEFKNILCNGKYFGAYNIEAFVKKNNNIKYNFIGIAVSSKVAKAVKRNKIKRLMKESYKNIEKNLETGNSIVFLWKKNANIENATYQNIFEDMKNILIKAGILEDSI